MSAGDPDWEARIRADFEKHPGSWRPDPENWFREGWLAGRTVGLAEGFREAADLYETPVTVTANYPGFAEVLRANAARIEGA